MSESNPFALSAIQAASAPPQEPDDANPFALRNIQQEQAGQLRVVTNDAVKVNPDAAAEVARLRKRYPTPDEVMLRNLQDVKLQAAVDDADEIYKTSPKLATAMREAGLIRQAHDDLPQLARIESGFLAMSGAGAAQATLGVSESIWRTPDAASRMVGYLASIPEKGGLPRAINPIRGVQDLIDIVGKGQLPYFGKLFSGTTDVAERVSGASEALQDRATFGDAFADLSVASQNADLALAHALKGNGKPLADVVTDPRYIGAFVAQAAPSLVMAWKSGGSLPFIGWLEGMEQASSAADFEKRTGQKVDDAAFAQAFVQTATINALLERYGLDKVMGAKGKGLSSILKAMVAEGGTEGLQQVNTNLAEMLSFNPDKKLTEGVVGSVIGGAGSGGGGRAIGVAADRIAQSVQERIERDALATAEGKRLEGQLQTAADSKLRERNPEAFREVVAQLAEQEGTDSTVYVDAEVLNQLAPEVLNQLPAEVLAQLPQALQTGDVVAIPAADALTVAPGTPLEQMLVEHGRIGDPEAASQFEVKEQGAAAGEQLQQAAKRVIQEAVDQEAMQAGHDAVREGILTQLNTLGRFRPAVNEGYATWAAAFYTTMAGRTGMTPEAFAAKYPLKIVGQTGAGRVMEQPGTTNFDNWFGDSKVVDAEGKPLVVYHGTQKDFSQFSKDGVEPLGFPDKQGFYFTPNPDYAGDYGSTLMPVYLSIRNPYRAPRDGYEHTYISPARRTELEALGHDGVLFEGNENQPPEIVAFNPEQIKSATGNNGNFDPTNPSILEQSAFHGTPHRGIDKFSTDKIGTGEGNQAFGWGLYFAGKKEVAEHYRKTLADATSDSTYTYKGQEYRRGSAEWKAIATIKNDGKRSAVALFKEMLADAKAGKPYTVDMGGVDFYQRMLDLAQAHTAADKIGEVRGQTYQVELPEDSAMLDFNKDWSGQSAAVKAALKAAGVYTRYRANLSDFSTPMATRNSNMRGENIYAFLVHELGSEKAASQYLDGLGIPGMKYKGGTLAGVTNAGHNYVVFSGDHVKVTKTFYQQARGTFNPETLELALSPNADLSTFFHETGHFFLEVMADIASQPEAPATIAEDMGTLLKWFGVPDLATWQGMTLEQQRESHERFAEGIEQYLLEGKAPSAELQPVFGRFRAWMLAVYKSLTSFVTGRPQVQLSDDVRAVMDRLVASDAQIAQTQESMQYGLDEAATEEALSTLAARSVRDLKWAKNAFSRALKAMQAEAKGLRREVRIEARREILSMPVYQAFMFLTVKRSAEDKAKTAAERAKGNTKSLDPSNDSLLTAIAKLGGLQRESAGQLLGVHADHFNHQSGVFGKPVFRANGGLTADAMGEALAEAGYLLPSETGRYDLRELEDLIDAELRGSPQYSIAKQYGEEARTGEGTDLAELRAGRFDFGDLHTLGLPEGSIAKLEALGMTLKAGGIHPDIVADGFGFENGQDLVAALLAAESPLTAVEGKTDQLMLQRHGDLIDPRALEAAALQAVHNQARAKSLATELKAQADPLGARTDTGEVNAKGSKITVSSLMQAGKRFAADVVARTTIQDLERTARKHTAAERRAGQRWQEATAKGDTAAAIKAKQDQFLNNAAAKALMDAMGEARKVVSFFRDVVKDGDKKTVEKGRDPDVVNAARAILAAYGIGTRGEKSANDYLERVKQYDPDMFARLNDSVQGALQMAQPIQALTVEQLRSLHEEIESLWYMASRSRQMEVAGKLMDIDDAEGELVARTEVLGVPLVVPGEASALTPADLAKRRLQTAGSILRRVEQWAEGMDGKIGGPFKRYVFGPIKAAADAYRTDKVKYLKAYQALVDDVAPSLRKGLIAAPELGYTFGKGHNGIGHAELLHAILHTGNESNKRKLLLGRKWATENEDGLLDTARWDAFVSRMQAEGVLGKVHYDFAQGVWDLLEQTKPLAQKAHREVFGRYFAEVTADAFDTPFGSYRGGYVPAQADPRIVQDADMRALAEAENANMMFAFPTTSKGFTKSRVEYNRPLMLDLRTIGQHIDKVLLFAHMEPAVRDVHRLLERKGLSGNLGKIDPTIYSGMLTPWLKRSALQIVETPIPGDGGISRVASVLRARAGMALMFANVSNAIQQTTGFISAFNKLKADGLESHMTRQAALMLTSPKKMAAAVAELSPFMRNRMENEIGAINGALNEILLDPSLYEKAQAWSSKHAYFLQTALDNTMGPIIWSAGYNAMLTKGASEADAIAYADGLIRQTQGSTLPEDVSRLETGPAYARIFTQFISYFNMLANTNATALKQIATETGWRRGGGKALGVVFLGILAPLWVAEAIAVAMRGGPEDEERDGYLDDWIAAVLGMGTIKGTLAMVPFVGQLAVAAINRFNTNPADDRVSLSPAVSMLEASGGVAVHVYKAAAGEDINGRTAIRDVASLISLATGLPATALARPVGYLMGVEQGKIEPTGPVDAARGVVTGNPSPESKQR